MNSFSRFTARAGGGRGPIPGAARRGARAPRGVAILMVIVILAGLLALAAPFTFSMNLQSRAARSDLTAGQAQAVAEGELAHAVAFLHRNLLKSEEKGYDPTPDVDSLDELHVNPYFCDPSGALMGSVKIEDEQGKINAQSASPVLLGNLLYSTTLAAGCGAGSRTLTVADSNTFPSDGDPRSVDGYVCIGHSSPIPYTHAEGNQIQLARAPGRAYWPGTLVYDGRAYGLAHYTCGVKGLSYRPYRSVVELKCAHEYDETPGIDPNSMALRADEFAGLERFITVTSGRETPAWGRPVPLLSATAQDLLVEDAAGFGPGGRVRISQGGVPKAFGVVDEVRGVNTKNVQLHLVEKLNIGLGGSGPGKTLHIEPMMAHPINVNTAPLDVLRACFTGLGLADNAGSGHAITRAKAHELALFIKTRGVLRNAEDLRQALGEASRKGIIDSGMADAVYLNAAFPNSPKVRTSTAPFCYRSYGAFTIEATGIVSAPNGVQLARHTLRETLKLPTPPPGRFAVRSQEGFQKLIDQGLGAKVVTWPVALDTVPGRKVRSLRQPDASRGYVSLAVGPLALVPRAGDEWLDHCDDPDSQGFYQEGYHLGAHGPFKRGGSGGPMRPTGVDFWYRPQGGGGGVFFDQGDEEQRNRVTFTYEPRSGLVVRVYDSNLEHHCVEYTYPAALNMNEWYHVAASWHSSFPHGQEIRLDANPKPPDGQATTFRPGSVLSSDLGMNDGGMDQPDGNGLVRQAIFAGALEVDDASDFPEAGAVLIGTEIIEYKSRAGNSLNNLRRGARMTTTGRHHTGDLVIPYGYTCQLSQDLPVGGGHLVEDMPLRASTTVNKPGGNPGHPGKGGGGGGAGDPWVLYDETNKLPVVDTSAFPSSGYIIADGEIIYYARKSANAFEQLQRAQSLGHNSGPARNLKNGKGVHLASFQLTNNAQYDPSGLVQIDNSGSTTEVEWLGYECLASQGGKHYMAFRLRTECHQWSQIEQGPGPNPKVIRPAAYVGLNGGRGEDRTIPAEHAAQALVIPVVNVGGPQAGDMFSPQGDGISNVSIVTQGQRGGDVRFVKRAYCNQWAHTVDIWNPQHTKVIEVRFIDWNVHYRIGLNTFVTRRYSPQQSRLVRFPSGELPDIAGNQVVAGLFNGQGSLNGDVDEVHVVTMPFNERGARTCHDREDRGLDQEGTDVQVEAIGAWDHNHGAGAQYNPGWPTNGAFIRIGEEFMYYQNAAPEVLNYWADVFPTQALKDQRSWKNPLSGVVEIHPNNNDENRTVIHLSGLRRGLLNSHPTLHPSGSPVTLYTAAPFTVLSGAMHRASTEFTLHNGRGFPNEGYAWIGQEVVSWQARSANTLQKCVNFHGRYGTYATEHPDGELVRQLPFRYWDRDAQDCDGEGLAYFQAGHGAPGAYWSAIEIQTQGLTGPLPNFCRPRVLVRLDGQPAWDQHPTNQPGGLYQFTGTGMFALTSGRFGGIRADQIEVRVFWQYLSGAFQPSSSEWKRTFGLNLVKAYYQSPMEVKRVDEVEKR